MLCHSIRRNSTQGRSATTTSIARTSGEGEPSGGTYLMYCPCGSSCAFALLLLNDEYIPMYQAQDVGHKMVASASHNARELSVSSPLFHTNPPAHTFLQ